MRSARTCASRADSPLLRRRGGRFVAFGFVLTAGLALVLIGTTRLANAADNVIRVGMIPDAGATQVSVEQKAPLREYLQKALGQPVQLIITTNYNASVEALGNGSLDFGYLGGLTYVIAHRRYGVIPLVQRKSDQTFHSLFITQANSPIRGLADLKGRTFAFGDIASTSGHLMPCKYLLAAGIDADKDLRFRYTSSHVATAQAVAAGAVDAGAVDESVFHQMVAAGDIPAGRLRVFYTTPSFVDYVWVARKDIPAAEGKRFAQAFLELKEPRDAKILEILRGRDFVRANDKEYEGLRTSASQLGMLK
jgi:phosphonate transport system substrate-binding protein